MSNLQLHWTEAELLADDAVAEPLVAGGVRCHGGFDGGGEYVSPRTKFRVPATKAWQRAHREQVIGTLWDAGLELSLGVNRDNFVRTATAEVEHALASHPRRAQILEGFHAHRSEAAA